MVNPMEEEEEEEEVILEGNMEVEPQIELKGAEGNVGVEEAGVAPGPSHPASTSQPPDEEEAGSELLLLKSAEVFLSCTRSPHFIV